MSFSDHFSDQSDRYAAARAHYPDDLFRFIAAIAPSTGRAWDCGTGNGQAAIGLARYFQAVAASDPSAQQIAHALPCANVTYSVQPAESTIFPEASFDAVCVAQALHWFDHDSFFSEVRRVIKPRGVFAAWGYAWFSITPAIDRCFDAVIRQVIADDWAPQIALLWNGYRDVPFPFVPIAAPAFAITLSWNLLQLLAYLQTWSAIRTHSARVGTGFLRHAEAALAVHWGPPETVRAVTMPLHLWAGRVID